MPHLVIDSKKVDVPAGSTVFDAAVKLGIPIPTLCYRNGYDHFTSCMICVVKEKRSNKLIPSCSAPAAEGMIIETNSAGVRQARKENLDLLFVEHLGDCESPCRRACPAHLNIPLMLRQVRENRISEAARTIKNHVPFPAILGRICNAPCESACRRRLVDEPVAICLIERYVADTDRRTGSPAVPALRPSTGKRVAVVGSGLTGLSAAYYLHQYGHACTLYDDHESPGGMLRYGLPKEKLQDHILDTEIEVIWKAGVKFHMDTEVGKDVCMADLRENFDAVAIAAGTIKPGAANFGVDVVVGAEGIKVQPRSLKTDVEGIFAGGGSIRSTHSAAGSVADGRLLAYSMDQYLNGTEVTGPSKRFDFHMGKLNDDELKELMKEADSGSRNTPSGGDNQGFSDVGAVKEAKRCMHCDCRKGESCRLRRYADEYGADGRRYRSKYRNRLEKHNEHRDIVFEPGKCINCGLCVRTSERFGETYGFCFIGRGFDCRIGIPFNELLRRGIEGDAAEYVKTCPTGAISTKNA
jgi:NADPH-dependent 2,4-dienoyl-CoA reductase/sulfur reductase-like enzyme